MKFTSPFWPRSGVSFALALTCAASFGACASGPPPAISQWEITREAERTLAQNQEKFRDCYRQNAGKREPRPRGVVIVFFRLTPEGKVMTAAVRDTTLMDPATEVCIVRALKAMRFEKPQHDASQELTYPIKFSGYE